MALQIAWTTSTTSSTDAASTDAARENRMQGRRGAVSAQGAVIRAGSRRGPNTRRSCSRHRRSTMSRVAKHGRCRRVGPVMVVMVMVVRRVASIG